MKLLDAIASEIAASSQAGNDLEAEFLALSRRDPEILDFISTRCLDGIWYWDLENPDHGWISPRFWELLGFDPASRLPRRSAWLDVLHPDDRGAAQRNYDRLIADPDHPFDQIFRYFRADGGIAWMRCRGMALRCEGGRPTRMLGVHMDVTALKLTEHDLEFKARALKGAASELTRREQELQFIFDNLPLRIWYKDEHNRILHLNEPARRTTEAQGDVDGSVTESEDDASIMTSRIAVSDMSERVDPATGKKRWVRIDKIPYFDKSLSRRALLIVEADIPRPMEPVADGRQKAERELWRGHCTDIYARIPAMVHLVGSDGRLTEVSDQWLERTGFNREEVIGRPAAELILEHRAVGGQGVSHPLVAQGGAVSRPCRLVRKNGVPLAVELSSVTTLNPMTGTSQELVVVTDVSERDAGVEEIARLSAKLDLLHERMDRSIKTVAEQFREPLRNLEAAGARLAAEHEIARGGEGASLVGTIGETVRSITCLTEDLLAYATVLNRPLQLDSVDLQRAIRAVIAERKPELDAAGARIVLGPCPVIRADREMIEELFRRLLDNAIKFRDPARTPQIHISCATYGRSSAMFCAIRDNGVGFDPQFALRMFEPFAARDQNEAPGEGGLGLALCKAVCERHGWAVWAEGAGDQGSVFTIRLRDGHAGASEEADTSRLLRDTGAG